MFSFGIIFIYQILGSFLAIVLYGVLSALLEKYLVTKREHTAALLLQERLKEIAKAIRESNEKNGAVHEII